ncbi:YlcI/YnfO family protein [Klebsiella michiganensis]
MSKAHITSKTTYKGIRFPHSVVAEIDASVEREKADDPGANFSAWVLDACGRKLKAEQRKMAKSQSDNPDVPG